jgi:molecular chaperone DnaJ
VIPKKVTIKVKIPAGIEDGSRLRVAGEGEPGRSRRGDLYVYVRVASDPFFERHEDDVVCKIPVTYTQAVLGAEIEVPTLEGRATLKIPAGAQPNELLRMRGLGFASDGHRRGDQIVVVQITVPKKPSERQRELLAKLREVEEQDGENRGFFDKLKQMFG